MDKKKLYKLSTQIHKWAGITIGIQVFLWIVGGLYMSWFPIEDVRGEHLRKTMEPVVISENTFNMKALETFIANSPTPIRSASADSQFGEPIFRVRYVDGKTVILDPKTATSLSPVDAAYINKVAQKIYDGTATTHTAQLVNEAGPNYKGPFPVWQVHFDDEEGSVFYFSADTGALRAVRTNLWRTYDFMWMLHIMDYKNRSDFNSPLLIIFSLAALIFTITGFVLVFFRFTKNDFKWLGVGRSRRGR